MKAYKQKDITSGERTIVQVRKGDSSKSFTVYTKLDPDALTELLIKYLQSIKE